MYFHAQTWINDIADGEPDPAAANALQEGLDVEPGTVVLLHLPSPHWRLAYWALAAWSVGATVTLDTHEGADVLVTTDPDAEPADDADEVIVVTLAALAREYAAGPGAAGLRSGMMDEAKELASYGDSFTAWDSPDPEDAALVHHGERTAYPLHVRRDPPGWAGSAAQAVLRHSPLDEEGVDRLVDAVVGPRVCRVPVTVVGDE